MNSTYPTSLNIELIFGNLHTFLFGDFQPVDALARGELVRTFFETPLGMLVSSAWFVYLVLAIVATVLFAFWYTQTMLVYKKVQAEMIPRFATKTFAELDAQSDTARWKHVELLMASTKPHEWKQAVMECDLMLEEILLEQGCDGATVLERLHNAPAGKIQHKENALLAHATRLALTDESYVLTEREAYRTIKNYQSVFKEFGQAN